MIVIPAYNEARTVERVVQRVRERCPYVVVVDDGSNDGTGEIARGAEAVIVRHAVNRGLGAALGTGIAAALARGAECIVTMDADGQHDPTDIAAVIAPIERGEADVVIGSRFCTGDPPPLTPPPSGRGGMRRFSSSRREGELEGGGGAPRSRKIANRIANIVTRVLFGVRCSDTQSGFRAFSASAARAMDLRTNRMEVSSEILAEAARLRLRITEVPIRIIYTEYSLSKGQSFGTGVKTAWGLVLRKLL